MKSRILRITNPIGKSVIRGFRLHVLDELKACYAQAASDNLAIMSNLA